jgi:hypothetical protein
MSAKVDCDHEWFIMNQTMTKMNIQMLILIGVSVVLIVLGILIAKINAKLGGILIFAGVLAFLGLFVKAFINNIKRAALQFEYYTDKNCPFNLIETRRRWISPKEKYTGPSSVSTGFGSIPSF